MTHYAESLYYKGDLEGEHRVVTSPEEFQAAQKEGFRRAHRQKAEKAEKPADEAAE